MEGFSLQWFNSSLTVMCIVLQLVSNTPANLVLFRRCVADSDQLLNQFLSLQHSTRRYLIGGNAKFQADGTVSYTPLH